MKRHLVALLLIITLASCKKWLDVTPESEVSDVDMFSTEAGFQESLNGIYTKCTEESLYGLELTIGMPEVLAQNYTISFDDRFRYQQTALYNYKDPSFIARKDDVWAGLYNAITNSNTILERIDERKNLFDDRNYAIIKGEALALRAYLHFDALRLFAPSFLNNSSAPGIPYITTVSNKVTPMSTVAGSIEKIIEDLKAAKELLSAHDPIRLQTYEPGYPTDEESAELLDPLLFLQNRRHRMNYYAVCATLARVNLYKDSKAEALEAALEVINAEKFPWTKQEDFIAANPQSKDRILYKELIFSWHAEVRTRALRDRFEAEMTGLYIEPNSGNTLYETGGVGAEDLRFKEWFRPVNTVSGNRLDVLKYVRNDDRNRHYLVMPAIRLSEMYYIAAEAIYDTDPAKAAEYFNTVRANRGIGASVTATSREEFLNELMKEIRKETYAEGQVFYAYKRLHRNIVGQSGSIIPASNSIFVLPLPNDEIEFGGR